MKKKEKIYRSRNLNKMGQADSNSQISFSWDLHYACNYRCPYCWWDGKWQELAKLNRYLSIEQWMKHWRNIYSRYGSVSIEILGGEPFIYPNFTELIKKLSSMHSIRITTNLSTDIEGFIRQIDSSRVKVSPTFHPLFAKFDSFIKKTLLLKENGFTDNVAYLAYPPQIKQISYYKERFNQEGLVLSVMTFWGEYKGINYPDGYTEEEREIIGAHLGKRADEEFQLTPKEIPKGRLCRAGQKYAVIQADGNVIRCGGSGLNESIGNFFNDSFKLLKKPMPCKAKHCKCNEWAFLLVGEMPPAADIGSTLVSLSENFLSQKIPKDIAQVKRTKFPRLDPPYRVFWNWDIIYDCNVKCSYCHIAHGKYPCGLDRKKPRYVSIAKWKEIWDRIFDEYYTGVIRLSGGEPSVYPNFIDLVAMLSEKYIVDITTNLTFDLYSFLKRTEPDNIAISASFHPEFIKFEKFLDKLLLLYNEGYPVSVCFVAHPRYLEKIKGFKDAAEQKGILFKISPFEGEFEGRRYPQSYNAIERRCLEGVTSDSLSTDQININTQWYQYKVDTIQNTDKRRKLCRMGQMYAKILPSGDVTRCCVTTSGDLGNIFDGDLKLLDSPQPCEVDTVCPCFKAMLVNNKEDIWLPFWNVFEHKIYRTDYIKQLASGSPIC